MQGNGSRTWMQRRWVGTQTLTVLSLDDEIMCLESLCNAMISATWSKQCEIGAF